MARHTRDKFLLPERIERLKQILESDLSRYTDSTNLPIKDWLFVEDIDSFRKLRDINPAMVAGKQSQA
jgi:hypothetical protein